MEVNVKTERKPTIRGGVNIPMYRRIARLKVRALLATQRHLMAEVVRLRAENRRLASVIRDRVK